MPPSTSFCCRTALPTGVGSDCGRSDFVAACPRGEPTRGTAIGNADNFANIPTRYQSTTEGVFGPDSATLATGDAGARVACGVVD
jgi:hypothetical protein